MKVKLLKLLRKESWNKYEIRDWSDVAGCKDKPWHICDGPKTALAYHEYATKDEAIEAAKLLWHEEAENIYGVIEKKENVINILGNMYKSKEGECIECGYVWLCQQMLRGFNKPHTCNGPYKYKL